MDIRTFYANLLRMWRCYGGCFFSGIDIQFNPERKFLAWHALEYGKVKEELGCQLEVGLSIIRFINSGQAVRDGNAHLLDSDRSAILSYYRVVILSPQTIVSTPSLNSVQPGFIILHLLILRYKLPLTSM